MKLNVQAFLLTIIIIGTIFLIVFVLVSGKVRAAPAECMTLTEARAKWPKAHLWWHTKNRCWDNQPTSRRGSYGKRKTLEVEPKLPTHPFTAPAPRAAEPSILYPSLSFLQHGIDAEFLRTTQMTTWPLLIDIDEEMAQSKEPNEIDKQADELSFIERWQPVPSLIYTVEILPRQ